MSLRVQRLGARLLGHAPTVAPRVAARFEPAGNEAAPSVIAVESVAQPATPPAAPPRDPPVATRAEKSQIRPVAPPPIAATAAPTLPTEKLLFPAPEAKSIAAPQPAPADIPAPKPSKHFELPAPVSPPAPPAAPLGLTPSPAPAQTPAAPAVPSPVEPAPATLTKRDLATELRRLREWMTDSPPASSDPASLPRSAPPPARDPEPAPRRVAPPLPVRLPPVSAPAPPPAAVEINIGTIVVRANTPETKAPRAVAPSASVAAGLARFLARRSAGLP